MHLGRQGKNFSYTVTLSLKGQPIIPAIVWEIVFEGDGK
jgi:hypothetical protein